MSGTLEKQLQLEQEMVTGGIDRFRKTRDQAITSGKEAHTLHGRVIISRVVEAVAEGIRDIQQNPKSNRDITYSKLKNMDAEQVAYLAVVTLVDSISKNNALIKVARAIGGAIELQDRLDKWIASEGETARNTIKKANEKGYTARRFGLTHKMNKDGHDNKWAKNERLHVGVRLVDTIIVRTGIVHIKERAVRRNKTINHVAATPETEGWIKAFNDHAELARPKYSPCVIIPKDWTDVIGGGYHSEIMNDLPVVRRK